MTPEELMSWMDHCPVCGRDLTRPGTPASPHCVVGHGAFRVINGLIVFDLNTSVEDYEE